MPKMTAGWRAVIFLSLFVSAAGANEIHLPYTDWKRRSKLPPRSPIAGVKRLRSLAHDRRSGVRPRRCPYGIDRGGFLGRPSGRLRRDQQSYRLLGRWSVGGPPASRRETQRNGAVPETIRGERWNGRFQTKSLVEIEAGNVLPKAAVTPAIFERARQAVGFNDVQQAQHVEVLPTPAIPTSTTILPPPDIVNPAIVRELPPPPPLVQPDAALTSWDSPRSAFLKRHCRSRAIRW